MSLTQPLTYLELERFFSLSSNLLAIVDEDGSFQRVNPAFEQILGYRPSDLINQSLIDFIHSDDQAAITADMARWAEGERITEFRARYRCQDGRWKWLEWTIRPFRESENQPTVFYCIARDVTERHQIAHALRENEQRFQAIFNQTYQLIGLLTPDGKVLEMNETGLTFGGFSTDDVLGKPFWEMPWWQISDQTQQDLKAAIAKAANGEFIRYEVDVLDANRQVATLDFSLKPLRDKTGEITLLIPEGRNITERKAAEAKIRQLNSELEARVAQRTAEIQQYVDAIENMQDGFYLWQLENPADALSFRLLLANPAAEQLCAVPNEHVLGQPMAVGFPRMVNSDLPDIYRQVVLTQQERDLGNIGHVLPTGETRIFTSKLFPLAEQCLGVLFEDVTERRHIQQQLSEQREQLKIIFENAGLGIARLSLEGRWLKVNEKLCEILGYSQVELLQTTRQDLIHPADAIASQAYYEALLSGQLETTSLEQRYLRKDGTSIWCRVTASLIQDEQQQPRYFIAFIEDITERKAAELTLQRQKNELTKTMTKLESRNRELDQFAYVASHDLKAPLRAISNLATWLEDDVGEQLPSENQRQLTLLIGRVHRMEKLIDGLLAYSRAGRGNQTIDTVNLHQLLKEQIDLLAPPPTFIIDLADDLPTFTTNRIPLIQVFTNLISNAIKHHHRTDGSIQIRWQPSGDNFYEFSVTDDGPGIDPTYQGKIFDMFQVLEARDIVENTGIGLAIVKKTVEAEGGEVFVDSQVGQGTTFRFTWPQTVELSHEASKQPAS